MPISKIPVGALQAGTIGTSQIADNAVTTAKILNDNVTSAKIPNNAVETSEIAASAVTRDELQSAAVNNISSDSIILNSTNGTADAGDFLVLDGTDGSSSNENHRILYDETFVDKIGLFNINTLGSAGQALKVNTAGNAFEFGAAGGLVLLEEKDVASGSAAAQPFHFQNIFSSTYRSYKAIYTVKETESQANDTNCGLIVRLGTGGTLSTETSSTVKHSCHYIQGDANQNSVVYGDSDDILVFCQNFSNNENMLAMGTCEFHNFQTADIPAFSVSETIMHGSTNSNYFEHAHNLLQNNNNFTDVSFEIKVTAGGSGGNMDHTTNGYNVFGNVKIYGII